MSYGYNNTDGGINWKASSQARQKMSVYARNRKHGHKQKLIEAHKGQIPWNKGKTGVYSDESIKKMSEARKGSTGQKGEENSCSVLTEQIAYEIISLLKI